MFEDIVDLTGGEDDINDSPVNFVTKAAKKRPASSLVIDDDDD